MSEYIYITTNELQAYGASKGSFLQFMKTINAELKQEKLNKNIFVHTTSPGMVWTNLLAKGDIGDNDNNEPLFEPKTTWIINALTENVQTVTSWLVPRIRGVATKKKPKPNYYPQYLTTASATLRIMGGAFFGYGKNRFVDSKGYAVQNIE